jgi:hypothetical protein
MRTKRKKVLYVMFLLITVLMFLHSWRVYVNPPEKTSDYVKKHHKKKQHPIKLRHNQYRAVMASNGIDNRYYI